MLKQNQTPSLLDDIEMTCRIASLYSSVNYGKSNLGRAWSLSRSRSKHSFTLAYDGHFRFVGKNTLSASTPTQLIRKNNDYAYFMSVQYHKGSSDHVQPRNRNQKYSIINSRLGNIHCQNSVIGKPTTPLISLLNCEEKKDESRSCVIPERNICCHPNKNEDFLKFDLQRYDTKILVEKIILPILLKQVLTPLQIRNESPRISTVQQKRYFSSKNNEHKATKRSTDTSSEKIKFTNESSPTTQTPPPQFDFKEMFRRYNEETSSTSSSGKKSLEETYRYIELLQSTRAKALLEQTSMNIRRALWGNIIIAGAKLMAWTSSGSSAMLSEFIHSCVDVGNQALLLLGLRDSNHVADNKFQYGYGKSMYFWALVSALGTFWLGAGVSMRHSIEELMDPSLNEITWHVWSVLGFSLAVDGYVFLKTVKGVRSNMEDQKESFFQHVKKMRDPATLAILLEDGAACLGIVIASTGIVLSAATGSPIYDGLAGVGVSGLLATMGLILVRLNQRFLLGQAVDPEIVSGIEQILLKRKSIDGVYSVQSQWFGPDTFSYKVSSL